ncbi:low molecular weight phosphotyrosine protein phosphatase [Actinoplanes sp. SE50]|uniref:arsenate reductase/protein-tyrosine-phosphatase family protein n=1 Tax=unclassified Actinoplanes TaxID=2626549 RepID=UPI00023EDFAD|nr:MULTISPECIES: low molecular weight phosphotyrosine protein phosphatase [unclassified Actinoplanes]AEV88339.1 protein-tyrosine phosphatase [Actinoplanes sp. SE50/110]ATO86744.1 low molecular weight phosphotyrosine protein phosphatase [Actinoplanes sp. SE50]SLM04162.1 low molecular weight phosphotyrosine protein phosphatase [Actinoplanes sp. SE50/110]
MAPFTVLHICMGNICRSPMAERLLDRAVRDRAETSGGPLLRSVSAGTGGWHEGEEMNPPAARQVRARRGSDDGFQARKLRGDFIDEADLILTATADQFDYVVALRPDAADRTFVLGEFGRLLGAVDAAALPPAKPEAESVHQRGAAIVEAVARLRGAEAPLLTDDLDDPWGRGDQTFQRVADEIEDTTVPFATLLLP